MPEIDMLIWRKRYVKQRNYPDKGLDTSRDKSEPEKSKFFMQLQSKG